MKIYRIIVERKAVKEIESLPAEMLARIMSAISNLREDPRPFGVKKLAAEDGWRIRVGDYRILYTVDDQERLVTVYRVKHRREVYR